MSAAAIWHDVECHAYVEDLPLWRELAAQAGGPILDVGAGTGRVTLDLARRGHEVVALDLDGELLGALRERAGGLPVQTVVADARDFDLDRSDLGLVLVPMQTLQLLGGATGRAAFLCAAHRHLAPGGWLAAAIADPLDGFDDEHDLPPRPDLREVDGTVFCSQVVAVRDEGDRVAIERIRQTVDVRGAMTAEPNVIALDRVDAATVALEAAELGYGSYPPRRVAMTEDYVGSEVVLLWRR
jgi:SAM-dependent methyltransferase